jgi:hypothetical protein
VDRLLKSLARFAADTLRRRIGRSKLGVLLLDGLQPPNQDIIFGIADLGLIENVILMFVMAYLFAELFRFSARIA